MAFRPVLSGLGAFRRRYLDQADDLWTLAIVLFAVFGLDIVVAKVTAIHLMFAHQTMGVARFAAVFVRALSRDLFLLGAGAAGLAMTRRLTVASGLRVLALGAMTILYMAAVAVTFVNVGFFVYLGMQLRSEMLLLAPGLAGYLLKSFTGQAYAILALCGVAIFVPLALAPTAWRRLRRVPLSTGRLWAVSLVLLATGAALEGLPARERSDAAIRNLSPLAVLLPNWTVAVRPAPLTPHQQETLSALLGSQDESGRIALLEAPRRQYNVVFWVWESVGERYLASHSPLGHARTPRLDRLAARGAVRFTNAFAESPLSVQSCWALLTGMHPPSEASAHREKTSYPHPPALPAVLRTHGYATSYFNGSFVRVWGEDRLSRDAGVEVTEDAETLANRSKFVTKAWAIDDHAVLERFRDWLAGLPTGTPFFSMVWTAETHQPYLWAGTPAELDSAPLERYRLGIERSDALLGELWGMVESAGRGADTILVVIGDHGEGFQRSHIDDLSHSQHLYEDDVHIPFVLVHPGLSKGERLVETPCVHADLAPTMLDLLGIPAPTTWEGVSLARSAAPRALFGWTLTWRETAVRAGRYKVLYSSVDDRADLVDWVDDPAESHDLSPTRPEIADTMRALLAQFTASHLGRDPNIVAPGGDIPLLVPPPPKRR